MNLKNAALAFALVTGLSAGMVACKSQEKKDAEAKTKIEAAVPGVTVSVKDGVATLSGELADDNAKAAAEEAAKKVVKTVTNNITVTPPPAPVVVNPDQALISAANEVVKAFAGVTASVKDGVVTLTGEIKKAELPKLMQALNAIHPKKVENKLTAK